MKNSELMQKCHDTLSAGQEMNPECLQKEAEMLTTQL